MGAFTVFIKRFYKLRISVLARFVIYGLRVGFYHHRRDYLNFFL